MERESEYRGIRLKSFSNNHTNYLNPALLFENQTGKVLNTPDDLTFLKQGKICLENCKISSQKNEVETCLKTCLTKLKTTNRYLASD